MVEAIIPWVSAFCTNSRRHCQSRNNKSCYSVYRRHHFSNKKKNKDMFQINILSQRQTNAE